MAIKYGRSCCQGELHSLRLLISSHLFYFVFIGPCGTVLQDAKECVQSKEEQNRLLIKNLEEENKRLRTRCTDLLNDLEKLRNQEAHWRKEKHSVDAEVKVQGRHEAVAVLAGRLLTGSLMYGFP